MSRTSNTKLRNSTMAKEIVFTLDLILLAPRIGDQKQKKCFEPCLDFHAQSWSNCFMLDFLLLMTNIKNYFRTCHY